MASKELNISTIKCWLRYDNSEWLAFASELSSWNREREARVSPLVTAAE
jgi:hypothetical protein